MIKELRKLIVEAEERKAKHEAEIQELHSRLIHNSPLKQFKVKVHDLGICGYEIYARWCHEAGKIEAYETVIKAIKRDMGEE